jgi:hypothetical protein
VLGGVLRDNQSVATEVSDGERELEQIRYWRLEVLTDAGYSPALAAELASNDEVDLHSAVQLLRRGCPPDLAGRILR